MSKLTSFDAQMERTVYVGLDVGDRQSEYCLLDRDGEIVLRGASLATTQEAMEGFFLCFPSSCVVALEVGVHSPWLSRLIAKRGHDVVVANPRQVSLISRNQRKSDRNDAELLARLVRADRRLLRPIRHRGEQVQVHRALLRTREQLVRNRTRQVNSVRGQVKSFGARIPTMDAATFHRKAPAHVPGALLSAVQPMLVVLETIDQQLKEIHRKIRRICRETYPETQLLLQVPRVGELTALAFVLAIEDPKRFTKSRDVPAFLGLVPRRQDSGQQSPELSITKAGDRQVRWLLVQCAQQILGSRAPDTDLKRWGLKLARRGKKKAKRRAVVAVARKLAVLLHRLWVTGEEYEPLRNSTRKAA